MPERATGIDAAADATAAGWARIEACFDAVFELDGVARQRYYADQAIDVDLQAEVERLLAAAAASADFLGEASAQPVPGADGAPLLPVGTQVGDWRVEALIGRGGSGEVYAVHRTGRDYVQRAALKLLTRLQSAEDRRRFADERRVLARLQHPAIATLLDGGELGGLSYAVMEFVDGRPLTEAAQALPLEGRIALFLDVCAAVSHAHAQLIVHRDLKPANLLVDAQGRVRLLDFGIARELEADAAAGDLTQTIQASTGYCAPEQLRGEPVVAATDVYALGVILHELLTGQGLWPAAGSAIAHALLRVHAEEPPAPSARCRGAQARRLRGDLDAIVLRALRNDPAQRYASVEAMAADLRAWQQGLPVQARGAALGYRIGRTLRRHRWWFASGAAVFASLLLGLVAFAWQAREAATERDVARREAERADAVRQYLTLMFRAAGDLPQGASLTAKAVLDQAAARIGDEFGADPQRHADVVIALAELYYFLNDDAGAQPLLERLLRDPGALEPAQAASANLTYGQVSIRLGDTADARQALDRAQAFWLQDPRRWRLELLESRLLQAQLEREAGDIEQSLATLQTALPERIALSGKWHRDTGVLVNNLGIALYHLGRSDEAVARFAEADRIWQALGLSRSADALNTLNNWAAAELRAQRPDAASGLFQRALALRRELYGPSTATAVLISNTAKTLLQQQRAGEALPLAREAVSMATQFAGVNSLPALAAQLGLADALTATGAVGEAAQVLDALQAGIDAGLGHGHLLDGLLAVSRARWSHAQGESEAAKAALDEARRIFSALGAAGVAQLAALERLQDEWQLPPAAQTPVSRTASPSD